MKQMTAVVVGYGNRGEVYASYSISCPNELKIVGVVDPDQKKRDLAKKNHGLLDKDTFTNFKDFVASGIKCDFIINATVDQLHYETTKEILSCGFNILMEKPIVPNKEQLEELISLAEKNNCKVLVCHVLRYTPFYKTIKQLILDGEIGDIVSLEMSEHVSDMHFSTSYIRGKWNSEKICGSTFLLAKSCHDIDIMCWLNNSSKPKSVFSHGGRYYFTPNNMPKGATDYCVNCPHSKDCMYSSEYLYVERNVFPFLTWGRFKDGDKLTKEQKLEILKTDTFGRCVFNIKEGDIADRQSVSVKFENGSVGSFTLIGGTVMPERYIHILGTKGEIEGKLSTNKIRLRKQTKKVEGEIIDIDVSDKIVSGVYEGHAGGDYAIMHDVVRYFSGEETSISMTTIRDSVAGHLCVYGADNAMKTGKENNIDL